MAGVPQPESLRQRIVDLLAQVEPLLEELEQAERIAATSPGRHGRPQLRLIRGGKALIAVPILWAGHHLREHAATAVVAAVVGFGAGGAISEPPPADAEARSQPYQGQPFEGTEEFQAPRPATHVPSPPRDPQGAVPSPSASPPTPTGAPGPAPAQSDATPDPSPLWVAPLEPEPGLAPPTSTPTMTPTPTVTPNPGLTRKAAVLECVGEPGGEPPTNLVACVDALLGGS